MTNGYGYKRDLKVITKEIIPTCEVETPRAILSGLQWLTVEKERIEKNTGRPVSIIRKRRKNHPKLVMWLQYADMD